MTFDFDAAGVPPFKAFVTDDVGEAFHAAIDAVWTVAYLKQMSIGEVLILLSDGPIETIPEKSVLDMANEYGVETFSIPGSGVDVPGTY